MKSAIISGTIGWVLSWYIGTAFVGLTTPEALWTAAAANVAAPIALLMTLWAERRPGAKKGWLRGALRTWALITVLYLSMMVTIAPPLRSVEALAWLFLPNLWSTGFGILVFGPMQDWVLRKEGLIHG